MLPVVDDFPFAVALFPDVDVSDGELFMIGAFGFERVFWLATESEVDTVFSMDAFDGVVVFWLLHWHDHRFY